MVVPDAGPRVAAAEARQSAVQHHAGEPAQAGQPHLYTTGFIAPHASIRKDAVDVDGFLQAHNLYTKEYLASIQPSHRNPAAWFEMVAWYWHLAVAALVSLLTNTWTTDSLTETTATWRMLFFCAAGQAGGAVAALANHASSVLRNRPDNGWVHTCLANAECARVHGGILAMAARPSLPMRVLGLALQVALFFQFLPIYLLSPSVFHAYCGYRAEEQMFNYSQALKLIDTGRFRRWRGAHAPPLALSYYGLAPEASLRDALLRMRADEACIHHVDFTFASLTPGSRNPFVTTSALEKEE